MTNYLKQTNKQHNCSKWLLICVKVEVSAIYINKYYNSSFFLYQQYKKKK